MRYATAFSSLLFTFVVYLLSRVTYADVMIKGLFYSEFDNVAGPVILFQAPPKWVVDLVELFGIIANATLTLSMPLVS